MPTHRENILKELGLPKDAHPTLKQLSAEYGVPVSALKEIEKRGAGAWRSNLSSVRLSSDFSKDPDTRAHPRSQRLGQQQWARARIYSFLDHGKTFYTADADIVKKYDLE